MAHLFALLQSNHLIPEDRAILYKSSAEQNNNYGFKSALWINVECRPDFSSIFSDFKGIWLIEHQSHKVQLLGSQQHSTPNSIGGCVIRDIDILSINAHWISDLAFHYQLQVLIYNQSEAMD